MLAWLRSHLTFANVVSLMALFVALGGGAYALTLPKNSVGAKQLKKNAVQGSKIKNGAVTSSKVKDASLLSTDFKPGQLPSGPQGPQGSQGSQGPQGPPGVQGVAGSARAYAQVENDGPALISARTKNFTSVTHTGGANSGRYCLTPAAGIDPNTVPAVVSPEHGLSSGQDLAAYTEQPQFDCAASQFEVLTQQAGVNSDNVAFTIIVP
jgi:hypothetical protein